VDAHHSAMNNSSEMTHLYSLVQMTYIKCNAHKMEGIWDNLERVENEYTQSSSVPPLKDISEN